MLAIDLPEAIEDIFVALPQHILYRYPGIFPAQSENKHVHIHRFLHLISNTRNDGTGP